MRSLRPKEELRFRRKASSAGDKQCHRASPSPTSTAARSATYFGHEAQASYDKHDKPCRTALRVTKKEKKHKKGAHRMHAFR